jgi:putative oxygen-independent coproporphyrinogen III oxidase
VIPVVSEALAASGQANPDVNTMMRDGSLMLSALPPLSLYVHLPWCLRKCPYCDFNSHAAPGGPEDLPQQAYIDALMADLEAALPLIWGRTVHTVFIGGGTPSLFEPQMIDQLIASLRARLDLAPGAEITLEANPGTFETDRFAAFAAAGVTRLSIGVQSFDDGALHALGRVHSAAQAHAAIAEAQASFATWNLDLMYALPGQDLAMAQASLAQALAYAPPHLSVYHLTVEPNTYFAKYPPELPDEDTAYDMLDAIGELTAKAGLSRYEVSAFARPGHRCQHNLNYWQFGDYLGIGAGAHSKLSFAHRVLRQVRLREPTLYMQQAMQGRALSSNEEVGREALPFEFMLNALRLPEGFALRDFSERTGLAVTALERGLQAAQARGLVTRDWERVVPTARGMDFLSDLQALFLP